MYITDSIILRRTDSGEADAFFTIYTKDFGKIRALAQGVKKEGAKLKGHLEPLCVVRIQFVAGKNGARLTHASLLSHFPNTRAHYEKLAVAWYLVSLVDVHCLAGERDIRLWHLLSQSLEWLESKNIGATEHSSFVREFESAFVSLLGYGDDRSLLGLPMVSLHRP